jgi:hypothetical protein
VTIALGEIAWRDAAPGALPAQTIDFVKEFGEGDARRTDREHCVRDRPARRRTEPAGALANFH